MQQTEHSDWVSALTEDLIAGNKRAIDIMADEMVQMLHQLMHPMWIFS